MTYFDAEAETYDSWYETALGSYVDQAETEAVFDLLKPVPGEKIIDGMRNRKFYNKAGPHRMQCYRSGCFRDDAFKGRGKNGRPLKL